jgi:DNA-binding IclR family transcriptional regulator
VNALKIRTISRIQGHTDINTIILSFISQNQQSSFTVKEIIQATGVGRDKCYQALELLRFRGLVKRSARGRALEFTAATGHPALPIFKVFTTILALDQLLERLRTQTERIVLYEIGRAHV